MIFCIRVWITTINALFLFIHSVHSTLISCHTNTLHAVFLPVNIVPKSFSLPPFQIQN
jgi:hypothetical protein